MSRSSLFRRNLIRVYLHKICMEWKYLNYLCCKLLVLDLESLLNNVCELLGFCSLESHVKPMESLFSLSRPGKMEFLEKWQKSWKKLLNLTKTVLLVLNACRVCIFISRVFTWANAFSHGFGHENIMDCPKIKLDLWGILWHVNFPPLSVLSSLLIMYENAHCDVDCTRLE